MNLMEDLKAYVDGELSPARRAEVEAAMDQDERLRQEVEELRILSRLIGDCVVEPEPVGLDATLSALEKAKPRPLFARVVRNPLRYGWAFALCGFLVLAICFPLMREARSSAKDVVAMDAGTGSSVDRSVAAKSSAVAGAGKSPEDNARLRNGSAAAPNWPEKMYHRGPSEAGESDDMKVPASEAPSGSAGFGIQVDGQGVDGIQIRDKADVPRTAPDGGSDSYFLSSPNIAKGLRAPMLIRSGDFSIQVQKVSEAQVQVNSLAKRMGGYVEQSQTSAPLEGQASSYLAMRVPVQRFDPTIIELRKLGKVLAEATNGQDVTAQVVDTEARLKAKKAEEQGYVDMMKSARKVPDMLEIRDRLGTVREEIESMEAERKSLREQAAYSTIGVTLSQPTPKKTVVKPVKPSWFDTAWQGASERASGLGRWLAEVGMNLLVLAPVWVPIVVGLWWLGRRARLR